MSEIQTETSALDCGPVKAADRLESVWGPAIERAFVRLKKPMPISTQQLLQILPNAGQVAGFFTPGV